MSILSLVVAFLLSLTKSRRQLLLENLALKQQVTMLRQSVKRPRTTSADRLFWVLLSRHFDGWRQMLHSLHPDTVVRWHRRGFRLYWRWKSRGPKPDRPAINIGLRKLICEMQASNIGWGAPRIHGELITITPVGPICLWRRILHNPVLVNPKRLAASSHCPRLADFIIATRGLQLKMCALINGVESAI